MERWDVSQKAELCSGQLVAATRRAQQGPVGRNSLAQLSMVVADRVLSLLNWRLARPSERYDTNDASDAHCVQLRIKRTLLEMHVKLCCQAGFLSLIFITFFSALVDTGEIPEHIEVINLKPCLWLNECVIVTHIGGWTALHISLWHDYMHMECAFSMWNGFLSECGMVSYLKTFNPLKISIHWGLRMRTLDSHLHLAVVHEDKNRASFKHS